MFNLTRKTESHELDRAITQLTEEVRIMDTGTEEHMNAVAALKTLMEARTADKTATRRSFVSPEVLTSAGAQLAGIIMILTFEKANVITSKSLGFVPKARA